MMLHVSIGRVLYKWAYPDDVIKSGESPTLSFSATPTSGTHPCFTEVLPIGYVGIGCYGDVMVMCFQGNECGFTWYNIWIGFVSISLFLTYLVAMVVFFIIYFYLR